MAEALVLALIGKISSILTEEAVKTLYSKFGKELSILLEVEDMLKQIASEFRVMQAFLSLQLGERNEVVLETWLKEVREVAHDVEDIIDEYTYLIGKVRSSSDSFVRQLLYKTRNIVSFHDIATRLENFKPRLTGLSDMKYRYGIMLPGESSSNFVGERQQPLVASSYLMDQEDLVGIKQERNALVTWLKDVGNPARSIIAVWGMGGSGKTTLLRNISKSQVIMGCFDFCVWITVSYKYQVVDILKRILKDVNGGTVPDTNSMDYMRNLQLAVSCCLEGKKYLIILDDVWSKVLWSELDDVFPKGNHGSRVVITTRNYEVAELACGNYVLKLECLGEEDSWDLFCRRAFWNEDERSCPPALEEWARKIVSKCQGLPLSLVAIGSLLSYRAKEVSQWKRFYDQINWELSRKENIHELSSAAKTLNLSYHYLPSHLKNCFLYCSIFPEDYLIEKDHIIRLWVAEGFIYNEGREWKALEEVAEEYYNELINRCLLQAVVWRDWNGSVINCRMHDIVRELTLTLSREQCFCMVVEDPKPVRSRDKARRLSVHEYDNDTLSGSNLLSLRTFIVFENVLNLASMPSVLSDCKYMRVLDLHGIGLRRVPDCVMHLFNLNYLSLRGTEVEELPKSIGKLRHLQTLDLWGTPIKKLPRGVIELKNLRHLFMGDVSRGVEVPKRFWVLKDLQTLASVKASNELVGRLGDLSQLRTFVINEVRGVHCRVLCASVAYMPCLYDLEIRASGEETLRLESLDGNQSKLLLYGRLAEGVVPFFGSSLRYLSLEQSGMWEDPLPSFSHLSDLVGLCLGEAAYNGQELCFRAVWFPNLKLLELRGMEHLERVEIEEEALQSLEDLRLRGLKELKAVPIGIEFLTTLQQLDLKEANVELIESIRGIDRTKVAHIPIIRVT